MIGRYAIAWLLLAIVAIGNGALREYTYGKSIPELAAHQVSTVTGIILTAAVVLGLSRIWPFESAEQAWTIGGLWLLLTIAFEFGFGRIVAGHPWSRLFADYNLLDGRIWLLFLAWVAVMPYVAFRYFQ